MFRFFCEVAAAFLYLAIFRVSLIFLFYPIADVAGVITGVSKAVQFHTSNRPDPSTKRIIYLSDLTCVSFEQPDFSLLWHVHQLADCLLCPVWSQRESGYYSALGRPGDGL